MRRLVPSDHGVAVTFLLAGVGYKPIPGVIVYSDGDFFIASDHFSRPASHDTLGRRGSQYLGADGLLNVQSPFKSITLHGNYQVYYRQTSSGHIFRRIYKMDGNLVFLGTVQKDIEDCKKPSSQVTPMDTDYVLALGWKLYEKEPSAEEKLKKPARADDGGVPGLSPRN